VECYKNADAAAADAMSSIEVAPVDTRHDLAAFVALPYALHRHDLAWTPPLRRDVRSLLDPSKNPFWEHASRQLFLARSRGRVIGRVAAIEDRLHLEKHGDGAGFFGFYESMDDPAAATALLDAAATWLRAQQRRTIRGPVNPSLNDEAGLLVDGFDSPSVVMMPHNPPYYRTLLEGRGFVKAKDLVAFQATGTTLPERLVAATEIVGKRYGVSCRRIDMERFAEEVSLIKRLFNAAWEQNWGHVPLTDREIDHLAAQLKPIVVPELVVFAEHRGSPVGFAAAVPDFNVALRANRSGRLFPGILKVLWASRRITRIRVLLLGVVPRWQGKAVDALLYRRIWEDGRRKGYDWAEAGWVLEDNHAMVNGLLRMGFAPYKTYRIYEKPL
jgi:GNAT superfamily N-acetyltransferase